jgi:glycine cleavage system H lipoate-binding protein
MEATDIFATKGIEYLIVIAYLVLLVGFWRLMARPRVVRAGARAVRQVGRALSDWFDLRDGFYFHQGHAWAVPESEDVIRIGMDDFAVKLLGRPGSVRLPPVGQRLRQGERGWEVEVDSNSIPVLSPVDGQVVAVNEDVRGSPALVSSEPYDGGWLVKVKVGNSRATLKNLLCGNLARAWLDETTEKLRQMQSGELGTVMADGGIPVDGFVRTLVPNRWVEVAREFLLSD